MRQRSGGAGTRSRVTLLHRLPVSIVIVLLALVAVSCGRGTAPESGASTPQIALHPSVSRALPAYVEVTGLSDGELSSLRESRLNDAGWQALLKITVGDGVPADSLPAVQGRYEVAGPGLRFTPQFPFDAGRAYRVRFDPSRLPRPGQATPVTVVVRLPAVATEPSTVVTAVHPSADVVPENLLRVYIEFSAPMGSGSGLDFVRLVELSGPDGKTERVEPGAFLPVDANFYSPDHTRYTLFFDPGRVKEGIFPNRQSGRPLRAGHRYALDIAPSWTDANGLALKAGYRHLFRVGPAVDEAIKLSDWKIAAPAAGTRDRLVVTFPRPLDHGILVRALSVERVRVAAERGDGPPGVIVDGDMDLEAHDIRWVFTPGVPWQRGEYNLVALSFLEDPQGNQIGRAFEVYSNELKNDRVPDAFRVAFTIR